MTARLAACRELAEDKQAIGKLINIYLDIEHGVSASSILFSWLLVRPGRQEIKPLLLCTGFCAHTSS